MTSKQRAYLKSLASAMDPIYQVGKASLTPEIITGIREAIEGADQSFRPQKLRG